MGVKILVGDCLETLKTLEDESVHCVVTSPPYWGLRDYGAGGQLGLEKTPEEHVRKMVEVFRAVRRVLRKDGTCWVNYGDCYATGAGRVGDSPGGGKQGEGWKRKGKMTSPNRMPLPGLKPKDLVGMPWRVAFALQADGWWLRSDIIWHKPNPMPESVTDRPTKAHEYVFLLTKAARYFYDADAVREPALYGDHPRNVRGIIKAANTPGQPPHRGLRPGLDKPGPPETRHLRTVWTIPTQPFPEAHFATFPEKLVEPCVKAGCPEGGTVLDPFGGSGTTGLVADKLGRNAILCELNPEYAEMARRRIYGDNPMFCTVEVRDAS